LSPDLNGLPINKGYDAGLLRLVGPPLVNPFQNERWLAERIFDGNVKQLLMKQLLAFWRDNLFTIAFRKRAFLFLPRAELSALSVFLTSSSCTDSAFSSQLELLPDYSSSIPDVPGG
jgi:hypothetical protein